MRQDGAALLPGAIHGPLRAGAFALCAALSGGCVGRATYDGAMADLAESREQASTLSHEADALRADARRAELAAEKHRTRTVELESANAELSHKVDDLMVLNAEMAERLKGAGQNVEQLASERGNLRQALADTRADLAEWRKQQQTMGARVAQQRRLASALAPLIEAKSLGLGVRRGRVVVTVPADLLFDPGMTAVKPGGRPILVQLAGALRALQGRSFTVAAHTDVVKASVGLSPNWQLSSARSLSVTRELVTAGLPPEAVSAAAHAEYDAVDSNDAEPGRARNRRIEIVLVPLPEELVAPAASSR